MPLDVAQWLQPVDAAIRANRAARAPAGMPWMGGDGW